MGEWWGSGCRSGGSPRHNVPVSGRKGGAFQEKRDKSCKIMSMSKNTLYRIPDSKVPYNYTKLRSLQDTIHGMRSFWRQSEMERQGNHDWWDLQRLPIRHKIRSFIYSAMHASIYYPFLLLILAVCLLHSRHCIRPQRNNTGIINQVFIW